MMNLALSIVEVFMVLGGVELGRYRYNGGYILALAGMMLAYFDGLFHWGM